MRGYLIYHQKEAEKNRGFIQLFEEEGRRFGWDFCLVGASEYTAHPLPDVVLNRTRLPQVSRWYEERGVPVFHSAALTEIGNDKAKMLSFLEQKLPLEITGQKWAPETRVLPSDFLAVLLGGGRDGEATCRMMEKEKKEGLLEWVSHLADCSGHLVIKPVDGHGGKGVLQCPSGLFVQLLEGRADRTGGKEDCERMRSQLSALAGRECLVQERIDCDRKDIRVYCIGGSIYQAMERQGVRDFRSNFSLGGRASPYVLSEREKQWVQAFLDSIAPVRPGLTGIDFLPDREGRLIFNEIEEMVGCRMLYQHTERNIVRDYLVWLKNIR